MRTSWTVAGCALIVAALALAPRTAAAQSNPFDRDHVPASIHNFGGGSVRLLDEEFQADVYVLGAFASKRLDRFERSGGVERPTDWTLYGRLGPMNFANRLEDSAQGLHFSFRRQGPKLTGRVYIGVHRTFH